MKKFINEHPKMYWMIVGLLAVIVFSIVTAVGCAKLERAEASDKVSPYEAYNIVSEQLVLSGGKPLSDYQHVMLVYSGSRYNVLYSDDVFRVEPDAYYADYPYAIKKDGYSFYRVFNDGTYAIVDSTYLVIQSLDAIVWSNLDVVYTGDNTVCHSADSPLKPDVVYSYLINAPYAVIDDFENYNVFLEYPRGEIDMSEFCVNFSLGGQPMNPENGYKMDYTLYVWLPSADYIRSKYGLLMEQDFLQNVLLNQDCYDADVTEWQKNVGTNGDSVLYKIPLTYEFYNNPETGESSHYRIKFDYKDLLDNMEYKLGDGENDFSFREYYGHSESEWVGWVRKMVFGHALISRMDAVVYTRIDDVDTYYGRTTTFTFLRNGNFVYSEVNKDALSEDISSDMSDGINNALQEGLIQSGDKVDELQQNINNVSGSLGSFDTEFEGVDLWNGIKGFGSGLVGLTGFLGNVATALGSVFVFMPYDVRQLVGYFFMASLVVALWKLIKR